MLFLDFLMSRLVSFGEVLKHLFPLPLSPCLPVISSRMLIGRTLGSLVLGLSSLSQIYVGEADSSLNGDDFNEEAWNWSMGCQHHLLSREDLDPSLAKDPFSSAV